MPHNSLLLRSSANATADLAKGFDPLHEKYLLNDTVEVSMAYREEGLMGDEVPYSLSSDNTIGVILLACFVFGTLAISFSRRFMMRQIKNFFYVPRSVADMTETGYESKVQLFLVAQTALTAGVFYYLFSRIWFGNDYSAQPQLVAMGVFSVVFLAYFLIKKIAYGIVDWTFFSAKNNDQWSKAWLFLTASEGLLLFPVLLLQVYFVLPLRTTAVYAVAVIILVKLLSLYKSYAIFFKRKGGFVHNILYFCALELVPLLTLAGILVITGDYLKVNY